MSERRPAWDLPLLPWLLMCFLMAVTTILAGSRYCGDQMSLCTTEMWLTGSEVIRVTWGLVALSGAVTALLLAVTVFAGWRDEQIKREVPREDNS